MTTIHNLSSAAALATAISLAPPAASDENATLADVVREPGDPRDTTSPAAMVTTWEAMLRGRALSGRSRATLTDWMRRGGVTQGLIRAHVPAGWEVADKSGAGNGYTRGLVAMVTPQGSSPYFVAIYVSDTAADFEARNAAVAEIAGTIVEVIRAR